MFAIIVLMMAMMKMAINFSSVPCVIRPSKNPRLKHGDIARRIPAIRYRGDSPPPRLCLHHPCLAEALVWLAVCPSLPVLAWSSRPMVLITHSPRFQVLTHTTVCFCREGCSTMRMIPGSYPYSGLSFLHKCGYASLGSFRDKGDFFSEHAHEADRRSINFTPACFAYCVRRTTLT